MENEIFCPKCHWTPDGGPYWQCTCGHVWNTFDTYGVCPSCKKAWADTKCPTHPGGCGAWSPHIDWYHGLNEVLRKALEEIFKKAPVS